jgi:hypothetical protein
MDKRHQRMLEEVIKLPGNGTSTLPPLTIRPLLQPNAPQRILSPSLFLYCHPHPTLFPVFIAQSSPLRSSAHTIHHPLTLPRNMRRLPRTSAAMGFRQPRHLPLRDVRECAPQDGHPQVESVSGSGFDRFGFLPRLEIEIEIGADAGFSIATPSRSHCSYRSLRSPRSASHLCRSYLNTPLRPPLPPPPPSLAST